MWVTVLWSRHCAEGVPESERKMPRGASKVLKARWASVVSISGGLGQHIRRPTRGVAEWVRGGEEKGWEGQWRRGDRLGGPGVPRRP